jgi:hypothetical protein
MILKFVHNYVRKSNSNYIADDNPPTLLMEGSTFILLDFMSEEVHQESFINTKIVEIQTKHLIESNS